MDVNKWPSTQTLTELRTLKILWNYHDLRNGKSSNSSGYRFVSTIEEKLHMNVRSARVRCDVSAANPVTLTYSRILGSFFKSKQTANPFFSNLRTMYIAYHVFHPPQDLLQLFELIFLDVVNFSVRNRILKNQRFSNTTKIIELSISDVMKFVKDFDAKFSLFSYYLSVTLRGNRSISK